MREINGPMGQSERFIILTVWKILHDKMPNDLNVQFRPQSRLGLQAIVPNLPRNCSGPSKSLYDSSFAVVGPSLWNCLPSHLTTCANQTKFKDKLTEFLIGLPDEPPVKGYQRAHNNTLAEAIGRLRMQ